MDERQRHYLETDQCILVDECDRIVGTATKRECHRIKQDANRLMLHRAFSVFLLNTKNELLLQQRSSSKVTFPLYWTNTCCSHPLFNENEANATEGARSAARRKLQHELGISPLAVPPD
jgi:isopentenyl-diphosphate delta-isomerase